MQLKDILQSLPQAHREQLMYAFENSISNQYVEYRPGKFIGVNIEGKLFQIEQRAGVWSSGTLVRSTV